MTLRRRAFSLVELVVAVSLSLLLVAVAAGLFGRFSSLQEGLDQRLDGRRTVDALGERLAADADQAVAIAEVARCFDHAPIPQALAGGGQVRLDRLELMLLTPRGLERVRWSVAWDPDAERGYLWRETFPVGAAELPVALAGLAGGRAGRELLASGVTRFRIELPGRGAQPTGISDLTITGTNARLLHDELREPGALAALEAGDWVWLQDDRIDRPGFREGYYRVRSVEAGVVSFRQRIGSSDQVAFRVARLPGRLSLGLVSGGVSLAREVPVGIEPERRDALFEERRR